MTMESTMMLRTMTAWMMTPQQTTIPPQAMTPCQLTIGTASKNIRPLRIVPLRDAPGATTRADMESALTRISPRVLTTATGTRARFRRLSLWRTRATPPALSLRLAVTNLPVPQRWTPRASPVIGVLSRVLISV